MKIGDKVKLSNHALDNENYKDIIEGYGIKQEDAVFKIIHESYDESGHRGYDNTMNGMGLFDLEILCVNGNLFPCSLYKYELEKVV